MTSDASNRPLSRTELEVLRETLVAADSYLIALEAAGAEDERTAALVELVHRSSDIVRRRIAALDAAAVRRAEGR